MKTDIDKLYTNEFLNTILDSMYANKNVYTGKKYEEISELHRYIIDIFTYNSRLLDSLNDIIYSTVFLRRLPLFYYNNNVTEIKYIKYHLEYYFHKLFIIREIIRQLINIVYHLKLERINSIKDLQKKLGTENPSIKLLKIFEDNSKYYNLKRNRNVHRGVFTPDLEFDDLTFVDDFYSIFDNLGNDSLKEIITVPLKSKNVL